MSDVKRYDYGYKDDGFGGARYLGLIEKPDGKLVRASDYEQLQAERDELRAQVEAMRAALENAAKGILWLQASTPMSIRISKRASKDYNAAKRAALQAKP